MEEQIISFETSKLCLNKNIIIPHCSIFNYQYNHHIDNDKIIEIKELNISMYIDEFIEELCFPTQSLLQKWLREKHDMFVLVEYDGILFDVSIYGRYAPEEIKINSFLNNEPTFYTYEHALEAGLIEALKLIKND